MKILSTSLKWPVPMLMNGTSMTQSYPLALALPGSGLSARPKLSFSKPSPGSPEGKFKLGLLVAADAELADALDELLEVDLPVSVGVENLYHSLQSSEESMKTPIPWYQLGLKGLFHLRRPPTSLPYQFFAVHYPNQLISLKDLWQSKLVDCIKTFSKGERNLVT